jgi:hypothetical protein
MVGLLPARFSLKQCHDLFVRLQGLNYFSELLKANYHRVLQCRQEAVHYAAFTAASDDHWLSSFLCSSQEKAGAEFSY